MVERSSLDAYAVMGAGQALQFFRYPSKDLGPLEVEIELFAIKDWNLALDRVRHNDMRYRAVLVNES